MNARVAAGLSQDGLADRLGRRQSFIGKLETDARSLAIGELIEIAAATQRSALDLFATMISSGGDAGQRDGLEAVRVLHFILIARATRNSPLDLFASLFTCDTEAGALRNEWLQRPTAV